jgi:hypothetical protein
MILQAIRDIFLMAYFILEVWIFNEAKDNFGIFPTPIFFSLTNTSEAVFVYPISNLIS